MVVPGRSKYWLLVNPQSTCWSCWILVDPHDGWIPVGDFIRSTWWIWVDPSRGSWCIHVVALGGSIRKFLGDLSCGSWLFPVSDPGWSLWWILMDAGQSMWWILVDPGSSSWRFQVLDHGLTTIWKTICQQEYGIYLYIVILKFQGKSKRIPEKLW